MGYYIQWRWCMSHEQLCPVYDWEAFAAMLAPIIAAQWRERQAIRHWLNLVQATHRDAYTVEYLSRALVRGSWTRRDVATAIGLLSIEIEDVAA